MSIQSKTLRENERLRVCIYCYKNHQDIMGEEGIVHIQKETLLSLAGEHPEYEVVMVIEDCGTRDGFERVMQACEAGEIDVLLIMELARLGRNADRVVGILKKMELLDVQVVDRTGEALDYKKVCHLYEMIHSYMAEVDSEIQEDSADFRKKAIYIRAPLDVNEKTIEEQIQKIVAFAENMGYEVEGIGTGGFYDDETCQRG